MDLPSDNFRSDNKPPAVFQRLDLTAKRPYPVSFYMRRALWSIVYVLFFRNSLPRAFRWRRLILKCFGAKLASSTVIYRSVKIYHPWLLEVGRNTTISKDVDIYNLGPVTIGSHTVISHRVTICAGTHDHTLPNLPLKCPPIHIGSGVWIATEAFIGPGITVGNNSVVGARAVVVKDVPEAVIVAGNPARILKPRVMRDAESKTAATAN